MLQVARDLSKVSLCLFRGAPLSRWPLDNSPLSIVRSLPLVSGGLPSCPAKLCFEEHSLDAGNLSHFKNLGVGDEVIVMYV